MSELLSSITGGAGSFSSRAAAADTVSAGVTGDILTITPPAGQRVKLTHLSTESGFEQAGISVLFGSTVVIDEKILSGDTPEGDLRFSVGRWQPYGSSVYPNGNFDSFIGKSDEALIINKNTGNTGNDVIYGYEIGE